MRLGGGCILPDLSILANFPLQEQVLHSLREHAVVTSVSLTEENRRIRRIITIFNDRRCTSQKFLVDYYHSSSDAE